ncbi:MAG: helix-turn-helix domain-containing protein [Bacteroidota bacterium]
MDKVLCRRETVPLKERMLGLCDAMELFSGKWKFSILLNLNDFGEMRFKDLQETTVGISPKVLSKELQDLEENLLITRTVRDTKPVTVIYAITEYALQAEPVIAALINFGLTHREKIKHK